VWMRPVSTAWMLLGYPKLSSVPGGIFAGLAEPNRRRTCSTSVRSVNRLRRLGYPLLICAAVGLTCACGSTAATTSPSSAGSQPAATASPSEASVSTADPTPEPTSAPSLTPTPTPSTTATPYPPIVACTSSQLSVAEDTEPPWTEGDQVAVYMVVTNISDAMCSITGYAGVAPLDSAGHVINVTYEHGSFGAVPIPDPGIYRTPVIPGETAYFGMTWLTGTSSSCSSATQFLVSLPAPDATSVAIPVMTEICPVGTNPSPLAVTAINPGESYIDNKYHQ
jgi:hypothetical protein